VVVLHFMRVALCVVCCCDTVVLHHNVYCVMCCAHRVCRSVLQWYCTVMCSVECVAVLLHHRECCYDTALHHSVAMLLHLIQRFELLRVSVATAGPSKRPFSQPHDWLLCKQAPLSPPAALPVLPPVPPRAAVVDSQQQVCVFAHFA
jgi:hypothetical protein